MYFEKKEVLVYHLPPVDQRELWRIFTLGCAGSRIGMNDHRGDLEMKI